MHRALFVAIALWSASAFAEETVSANPVAHGDWMKAIELNLRFVHSSEEGQFDDIAFASHGNGSALGLRFGVLKFASSATGSNEAKGWTAGFEAGLGIEWMHLQEWSAYDCWPRTAGDSRCSDLTTPNFLNGQVILGVQVAFPPFRAWGQQRRLMIGLDVEPVASLNLQHFRTRSFTESIDILPVGASVSVRLYTPSESTQARRWPNLLMRVSMARMLSTEGSMGQYSIGPVYVSLGFGVAWH